jgi:hypothetical protein
MEGFERGEGSLMGGDDNCSDYSYQNDRSHSRQDGMTRPCVLGPLYPSTQQTYRLTPR